MTDTPAEVLPDSVPSTLPRKPGGRVGERAFVLLVEENEWEAETFGMFLPVAGNEKELARLRVMFDACKAAGCGSSAEGDECAFTLSEDQFAESEVDLIVKYAIDPNGYMALHSKKDGRLDLTGLTDIHEQLRKGDLKKFLKPWPDAPAVSQKRPHVYGFVNVVLDGPPGEGGVFVEVETDDGFSVNAGSWQPGPEGTWRLRMPYWHPDTGGLLGDRLLRLLQNNDGGNFMVEKDGDRWLAQAIYGREAPDSPMAGAHAIGTGTSLEMAVDMMLNEGGYR